MKLLLDRIKKEIYFDETRTTKNDGLIFTPETVKTQLTKDDLPILKWKPSSKLTVDCSLNQWGQIGVFNPINKKYLNFASLDDLIDGKPNMKAGIIEIVYLPRQGWKLVKERADKNYSNNFHTLLEILMSQIDNLDMETLVSVLKSD